MSPHATFANQQTLCPALLVLTVELCMQPLTQVASDFDKRRHSTGYSWPGETLCLTRLIISLACVIMLKARIR